MQTVRASRRIDAPPDDVREWMLDLDPFMRAAGFSEVAVEGETIWIAKTVGLLRIELTLHLIERDDVDLAYEQQEGIFDEMTTVYRVQDDDGASSVEIVTDFALAAPFVGPIFDATVVKRQRHRELVSQLDYIESLA